MNPNHPGPLVFGTCGGLTNQRISILNALMIGKALNRVVVMPELKSSYLDSMSHPLKFGKIYDVNGLAQRIYDATSVNIHFHKYDLSEIDSFVKVPAKSYDVASSAEWSEGVKTDGPIYIPCTFFKFKPQTYQEIEDTWALNSALQHSNYIKQNAAIILSSLRESGSRVVALHARIEKDWLDHCKVWQGDNCMVNTDVLKNTLQLEGIPLGSQVYVAGAFTEKFLRQNLFMAPLFKSYELLFKHTIIPNLNVTSMNSERELFAAIDYEVCRNADVFIGNSVSTFSALILMSRERDNLLNYASYVNIIYNTGDIPLLSFLPLNVEYAPWKRKPLKWVFCYNANVQEYDDAVKAAVASAIHRTSLIPVCIFYGPRNDLFRWLIESSVIVIEHSPSWISKLSGLSAGMVQNHTATDSHLYGGIENIIAAFLRVDIPIIGLVDPFILYTDVDVVFQKTPELSEFGGVLPQYYTVGPEALPEAICSASAPFGNSGVMLINLRKMRATYEDFIAYSFSAASISKLWLYGSHGNLDQGALNSFYSGKFDSREYPLFNWKAYWKVNKNASIIHFHGPKPHHYHNLIKSGTSTGVALFDGLIIHCVDNLQTSSCYDHYQTFTESLKLANLPIPIRASKKYFGDNLSFVDRKYLLELFLKCNGDLKQLETLKPVETVKPVKSPKPQASYPNYFLSGLSFIVFCAAARLILKFR